MSRAAGLVVEVEGRVVRLDGKQVYRIGRAVEADVVLTAGSVSRQHAELQATAYGWVLVDNDSQFGTYVEDERVTEYPVERRILVRCGPPSTGATLVVVPADEYDVAAATPPAASSAADPEPVSGDDATQVLALPHRPADIADTVRAGPTAPRTGPDLLLVAEGREHRFRHPAEITVGRRSDCTVVLGDPACSRLHGRIDPVPGGWTYTNLSNEGTFHDGRRLATRAFDGRVALRLGHPVAGPELTLVPILSAAEEEHRIARRRLRRRLAVVGGVATALTLVAVVVGVALVAGGDDPGRRSGGDGVLDRAKAATVKITAESHRIDAPASTYHGSGSIIRSDGLILTNAHVAAPESPGLADRYGDDLRLADPDYLLVSLTDGRTDTNARAAYRARVVEADGELDVAVVQIYATADGGELDGELDLPTVPIGSSGDLRAGDRITVLGFPAVAGDGESITVTTGVVSTVLNDPDLGPRSELDTDARIAPGNSGGMAIDEDGELIGIPTSLFAAEGSTVTSGRIRSIDVVKELIEKAEDATD
ncbi:trypsin-like peptidase domain-containing protein [Nocardioides sp. LHD-245]|uniref:trypsin-like peptidase domain-containing protein n=1 Tax=Nocardioides sp. LHD-245 TaxID=3051387 RepID=UPI0027DF0F90|nr:trypsin-like peptidase domain-containing protein [Nocardioides sp. LHD-245]